ncbi:MAG: hypothetical protein QF719_07100 [Chloroflexota bacterium]|jgi:hypothetical protein|nr:hypothetical protein [Chloroflexota bacterium]MDP6507480.1 hypothetical protein [Chloroflexota bacterium]MDP6757964.1 hypothetical protein [Chloroflexota bacterium]
MSHAETGSDRLDPALHPLLQALGSGPRLALTPAIRRWRAAGGRLHATARGLALQVDWEGRRLPLLWVYLADRNHPRPRIEIPLAALVHRLPDDLVEELHDDLATVRGLDLEAAGRGAALGIDDNFNDRDADRLVDILLDLARHL